MSRKFALIIGNTEYSDPGLAQLSAPGKDAEDFARVLKSQDICDFDDVKISINQPSSSVIEAIDEFFDQKKPDDMLILYFSGHGVKDESGSLYLAFKNTVRSRLRSTAIKSDYIREAMDQSRSKRQVLILDCCNSGAFPQGTKAEIGGAMGMAKAFQGYGRFVLTASDATQFAWEGDQFIGETDNSLFTHFLVKGLEGEADNDGDGKITVDELYDFAYQQISKLTPKQTPTKSSSKQEGEIILRENMRIEDIKPIPVPSPLLDSIENPFSDIRLGAVQQLTKLLNGKNLGLARSAREVLERVAEEDDSRQVSRAAFQALESVRQAEQAALKKADVEHLVTEKLESKQKAKEESDQLDKQELEEERIAKEKIEAEHLAEKKRLAKEKAESERKVQEETKRLAAQKAEEERVAKEKFETDRLAAQRAEQKKTAGRSLPFALGRFRFFFIAGVFVVMAFLVIKGMASLTTSALTKTPITMEASTQETAGNNSMTTKKIKIGLSFSDFANERWKIEEVLMRGLLEEKGYEVISAEANHDVKLQNDQIDNMVSQGIKGLIVVAEDGDAVVTSVDKAADAGVKVIAYDRLIKTSKIAAYLSFDNVEVGRQQALGVMTALGLPGSSAWTKDNPAKVVQLAGSPTDNNATLFTKGQTEVLQPYIDSGVIKIVAQQGVENWDSANALKLMENILTAQNNKVDAVVASNDGTALGALQAMKAQGLAGSVPISGQDTTADGCNSIVKGELTVSILKDIRNLSPLAIDVMDKLLKGEAVSGMKNFTLAELTVDDTKKGEVPCVFLEVQQVNKDNVYDLVVASEFQAYDDVYRDIPEDQRPPRP